MIVLVTGDNSSVEMYKCRVHIFRVCTIYCCMYAWSKRLESFSESALIILCEQANTMDSRMNRYRYLLYFKFQWWGGINRSAWWQLGGRQHENKIENRDKQQTATQQQTNRLEYQEAKPLSNSNCIQQWQQESLALT